MTEPHPLLDGGETRARVRDEWKRRQAIEVPQGTLLVPTIPQRIARLNPSERHELGRIINSLKLRKIIRRILAEAFWLGEAQRAELPIGEGHTAMERLCHTVNRQRSMEEYERAMNPSEGAVSIAPVITDNNKTVIEVPR